jgi:hypothetical protein
MRWPAFAVRRAGQAVPVHLNRSQYLPKTCLSTCQRLNRLQQKQSGTVLYAPQYFDGGDAWYTPLFKIMVDQSAWSVAWNSLYYVLLGEPRGCNQVDADPFHGLEIMNRRMSVCV